MLFWKCTLHDFPAFALFSHTNVQMSEGTFCRVEVQLIMRIIQEEASYCLLFVHVRCKDMIELLFIIALLKIKVKMLFYFN